MSWKRWKKSLTKITKSKKKLDISGISKIDQEYIIKYSQYISYYWVQHSRVLQVPTSCKWVRDYKFPYLPLHQTLRFFHINCKSIANVNLNWKDFTNFYKVIVYGEPLKTYVIFTYLNLTHFYSLDFMYRKEKGISLVGLQQTPPSPWRLEPMLCNSSFLKEPPISIWIL